MIITDLEVSKAEAAQKNWQAAGLADFIVVRTGDALQTLIDVGTVDLLFLDGAKELYLPVFELLYPKLTAGAVTMADNVDKPSTHDLVDLLAHSPEFNTIHLFEGRMRAAYRKS